MASARTKRPARSKVSKPKAGKSAAAKRPAPKKPAAAVKARAARPAAKAAKPAPKPAVKAAVGKPAVKGVIGKPAVKGVVGKPAIKGIALKPGKHAAPAVAIKGGKPGKSGKSPRMPAPPPVVRPLGVLPPEARVRIVEKAPTPAVRPKTFKTPVSPSPATQGVQRVTEKDLKFFEERLLSERQKLLKDMGHLETTVLKVNQRDSSGDLSGYSYHMADAGTDAMEREKAFMFASAEGRILMEIDDALRRLYQGSYGKCESCGNPIARARLEAMPYARLCVSCKEKEEKANRSKGPVPAPTAP